MELDALVDARNSDIAHEEARTVFQGASAIARTAKAAASYRLDGLLAEADAASVEVPKGEDDGK